MKRYIVGFTRYIDLPEGTIGAFLEEMDRQYGPGQGIQYIINHLSIIEDPSIEVKTDST